MRLRGVLLLLLCTALLALGLRALGAPFVFIGDEVLLEPWDGAYHARRALYSFVRFPEILFFDPYLRYPDGASVPMPPLYDWLMAGVARLFGSEEQSFLRVAAWSSPALAALTVLPVYAAGAGLAGRGVGLVAAALFAFLPASAMNSGVGDPDHHAVVALLVASYIALSGALIRSRGWRFAASGVGLGVVRACLVLCWSGSLLYIGLGEAALLLGGLLAGRRALLLAQSLGALGAALAVAPWVVAAGTPLGGPFSSTELSWLHCVALLAVATAAAGMTIWEHLARRQTRERGGLGRRLARAACSLLLVGGALLLLPALRAGLAPGIGFIGKADTWAALSAEQAPLFSWLAGRASGSGDFSLTYYGGFAFAIPLVPVVLLCCARRPGRAAVAIPFALWGAVLGALSIAQLRFGSDFAVIAGLGFALLLDAIRRGLAGRFGAITGGVCAAVLALLLLWPAFARAYLPRMPAMALLLGPPPAFDPALANGPMTLLRFAQLVRQTTPETSGYFDPSLRPEYSVLVPASYGHVMSYAARRATPMNNFGPYLDAEKDRAVRAFFGARREGEALEIAEGLGARYAVTAASARLREDTVAGFLHLLDGSRDPGFTRMQRFRLVAESPRGASTHVSAFPDGAPRTVIPYKLWERVEGALLEARVGADTTLYLELEIETNTGRRFRYRAATRAGADGMARLRLPYATGTDAPTHSTGPYRALAGARTASLSLSEGEVRAGTALSLELLPAERAE